MTHQQGQTPGPREPNDAVPPIDAYLDGLLSPADIKAFEERLVHDASLREQLRVQREIDARLQGLFAYPGAPASPAVLASIRPGRIRRFAWPAAIAAAILLAVAGVQMYTAYLRANPFKIRPVHEYYAALVDAGWKPAWVCHSDQEFADMVNFHLGSAVVVPLNAPGVELMGWSYADNARHGTPIGQQTLSLLTRVEGRNVLVLMDRDSSDRRLRVPASSGLHLHRREVNGVVLYELSPFADARVLPHAVPATASPKLDKGQVKILEEQGVLPPGSTSVPPGTIPPK